MSTVRMNISVPDTLKARMDLIVEAVNWSALACLAFEDKIAEIATRKEKKTMQDVIDRLKVSHRANLDALTTEGLECGRQWAMHKASAVELRRIKEQKELLSPMEWGGLYETFGTNY